LIVATAGGDQEGEQQYLARAHVTSAGLLLEKDTDGTKLAGETLPARDYHVKKAALATPSGLAD
jgi:hypothetical protein